MCWSKAGEKEGNMLEWRGGKVAIEVRQAWNNFVNKNIVNRVFKEGASQEISFFPPLYYVYTRIYIMSTSHTTEG